MSPSYPAGLVPSGARGRAEDRVGPDAPPDHVRLPGHAFLAVAEGGPAVRCPGHLEDARMRGDPLDPQAGTERPVGGIQVRDERFLDHLAECVPLLAGELAPVSLEPRRQLERGHQASSSPVTVSRCANISSADGKTRPGPEAIC